MFRDVVSTAVAIEHPVFFNMEGLLQEPATEAMILQGLNDLVHNKHSSLFFLFAGSVLKSKGVPFTHALISRFPSKDKLQTYYTHAIGDIAKHMIPWLKNEFCVDYEVEMAREAITLNVNKDLVAYVIFIKAKSSAAELDIKNAMDAFLRLAELGYTIQLTCGENSYMRDWYRTMSHGFTAYFSSEAAMTTWENDPAVISVLEGTILPLAEAYAVASVKPFIHSMDATK
ncbi:hypothetical protein KP509_17G078000 [Ceratopteris richardii]|uniref:Stress-response A/B barrel domain-containing protein n=1 Tax=Ceratopteris richardii TaxID=49495 RepID=A0A8T2T103_CERRI|nr:hypothetical protein KP509_17G078000 [Ceratopteris richardii]